MRATCVALIACAGFTTWGLYFADLAKADPLPACMFEDGSPDGLPCSWTDPDSGQSYYVDSSNYR